MSVDKFLRGPLKDYLDLLQSIVVTGSLAFAAYTFIWAPVDLLEFPTESGERGWVYYGQIDSDKPTHFSKTKGSNRTPTFKPGEVLFQISYGVNLRDRPRTMANMILGNHGGRLGTLKRDTKVCLLDKIDVVFGVRWLYVNILKPKQGQEACDKIVDEFNS